MDVLHKYATIKLGTWFEVYSASAYIFVEKPANIEYVFNNSKGLSIQCASHIYQAIKLPEIIKINFCRHFDIFSLVKTMSKTET